MINNIKQCGRRSVSYVYKQLFHGTNTYRIMPAVDNITVSTNLHVVLKKVQIYTSC